MSDGRNDRPALPEADEEWVTGFFAELDASGGIDDDEDRIDEILDRSYYQTARSYDPGARLPRSLDLRVHGDEVQAGRLDMEVAEGLLYALGLELKGAAEMHGIPTQPRLDLAGLSTGSAILHLTPVTAEELPGEGEIPVVNDPLDTMLATITTLHRRADTEGDLREFAPQDTLLRGLHELVKSLERRDLELEVRWRSGSGQHRQSRLTRRGRAHVISQWEEQHVPEAMVVTGRLVALDLKGKFTLRTALGRNKTYEIQVGGEADLLALGLVLGEQYSARITKEIRVNRAGLTKPPTYRFSAMLSRSPTLDGMPLETNGDGHD